MHLFYQAVQSNLTRGSAITEGPRVSSTLYWSLSIWIICSWTI